MVSVFRARSDKVDKRSKTNCRSWTTQHRLSKQNPESFIYVKVRSAQNTSQEYTGRNSALINRRIQAVARYFEHKGISANKLILLSSGSVPHASDQGANKILTTNRTRFEVGAVGSRCENGLD